MFSLSLFSSLSLSHACVRLLALSFFLFLSPPRDGVLFFSHLYINVPSSLEDGFSCYLLNKVEL